MTESSIPSAIGALVFPVLLRLRLFGPRRRDV